MSEKTWGIVLAGGSGSRLALNTSSVPKQFLKWKGKPLFWHSAVALARCSQIRGIVFVFPEAWLEKARELIGNLDKAEKLGVPWKLVGGGATRAQSSRKGVEALPEDAQRVLIHDAARPFLKPELVWRVLDALDVNVAGVIPVLKLKDTVKRVAEGDVIGETLPRDELGLAQTPQGFWVSELKKAWPADLSASITDDAAQLEMAGRIVRAVPGQEDNLKITTSEDLKLLGPENNSTPCSGLGYDVHRYGGPRPLKIGGVAISGNYTVAAHSDGDVLLHALADALLGCAALGDIGQYFTDSDPALDGISSAILLNQVLDMVRRANVEITHADLTVVAQAPKLSPFAAAIRKNVANLLALPHTRVNFKATTEEKMGFTGRLEGIKAYALVNGLLWEKSWP